MTCKKCQKQMESKRGKKISPVHILHSCSCGYTEFEWTDRYTGKGNDYQRNGND